MLIEIGLPDQPRVYPLAQVIVPPIQATKKSHFSDVTLLIDDALDCYC